MSVSDLAAPGVRVHPSPLETRRFGRSIARMTIGETSGQPGWAERVAGAVVGCDADVLVTRWVARDTAVGGVLAGLGRRVLPADNLLYWEVPTATLLESGRAPDADCRVGTLSDVELDELVADVFTDYPSHYSANPLLATDLALAGYREWAERTRSSTPDLVVSVHEADAPIAVATCAVDGDDLDILLAGVARAHQGGGRYATLLGGVARVAADRGIARVVISTQAGNVNVQRAWARAGFVPFACFATAHLVREGV